MAKTQQVLAILFLAAIFSQSYSSAISEKERELLRQSTEERVNALGNLLTPGVRNSLDDKITAAINDFISRPEVNPYLIPLVNVSVNEDVVSVNGTLDTVSVSGLSGLQIDKFHVNILLLKADFAFTLPSLVARGNYDIDAAINNTNLFIFGEGPFDLTLTGAKASGTGHAGLENGSIRVKSLDLDLALENFHVDIQHLMGDDAVSDFINEMINDLVPSLLVEYEDLIETRVSALLVDFINSKLAGANPKDVLFLPETLTALAD